MDDSIFMQMLNRENDFSNVKLGFVFLEVNFICEKFSEIPARQKLQDKDMARFFTEGEWSFNKMIACYFFEDLMLIFDGK